MAQPTPPVQAQEGKFSTGLSYSVKRNKRNFVEREDFKRERDVEALEGRLSEG
jgi:hypothetical protein